MIMLVMIAAAVGVAAVVGWAFTTMRARKPQAPAAQRRRVAIRVERDVDPSSTRGPPLPEAPAGAADPSVAAELESKPAPGPEVILLSEESLTAEARGLLQTLADASPRPRLVLLRLLPAGGDPLELARVVAGDPAIAALLLRTVNSAQFKLVQEITSVQRAITYLGTNLVRDIAIRNALPLPQAVDSVQERVLETLWSNSYLASAIAFALARQLRLGGPAELSTQALLFGLGDIALVTQQPQLAELYAEEGGLHERVGRIQRELGYNAALAGAHLGRAWQLPQGLCRTLEASLLPLTTPARELETELLPGVALGYFANRLAERLSRQEEFQLQAGLDHLLDSAEAARIPEYLTAAGLGSAPALLVDPALERRLATVHVNLSAGQRSAPAG